MCANFIGKIKEKIVWRQKIKMTSGVYKLTKREKFKRVSQFHRTAEELREFVKENDIKLLELLKYMRRRNDKKIQKGNYT